MDATVLDINGQLIDPLWAAEFRGYFFGDGYLGIVRNGYSRRYGLPTTTARAQITTRDDDRAMLEDIESILGGKVYGDDQVKAKQKRKPIAVWRTRNMIDVSRVCDVLDNGLMPSKKRTEIAVIRRYLAIRIPRGPQPKGADHATLWAERESCVLEIQRLHAYQPLLAS